MKNSKVKKKKKSIEPVDPGSTVEYSRADSFSIKHDSIDSENPKAIFIDRMLQDRDIYYA